jgi:hypothetical protein
MELLSRHFTLSKCYCKIFFTHDSGSFMSNDSSQRALRVTHLKGLGISVSYAVAFVIILLTVL